MYTVLYNVLDSLIVALGCMAAVQVDELSMMLFVGELFMRSVLHVLMATVCVCVCVRECFI